MSLWLRRAAELSTGQPRPARRAGRFAAPHAHRHPSLGAEREQRLRLDLGLHQLEVDALDEGGECESPFHQGEVVADGDARAAAEGEVRSLRETLLVLR